MRFFIKQLLLCVLALVLVSCSARKANEEKSGLTLAKSDFSALRGFEDDDFAGAALALKRSCAVIAKHPEILRKSVVKIDSRAYLDACARFSALSSSDARATRAFLKEHFEPYLVSFDGESEGRFTSYYEAEIRASRTKSERYKYPIYGRPSNLVSVDLQDFGAGLPNARISGRVENGKLRPYYTREQIEKDGLDAPVILWGDDKVDIFLMQVQGSALARLDDGSVVRVAYAADNGRPSVGVGKILLQKGLLEKGKASMGDIRDWLKAHPDLAQAKINENPRFIFHKISTAQGPTGALGATLVAGRSLAVDERFIPLGAIMWLDTTAPSGEPLRKLVAAQDTGGAIKGAIRGDYFWGHGEEALKQAGKMNSRGRYYILIPRN